MEGSAPTRTQQIIDRRDRYMSINYPRYPVAMVRGEGCRLYDAEGKRYLDLFAGFGASLLGHCQPDLVQAVSEQAQTLWHAGNLLHTEPQTKLAEAIATHGFNGRSFFCHSGADANEAAIKLARLYGKANPGRANDQPHGRYRIITAENSFHGRSFGTMVATGQRKVREGFDPWLDGFTQTPFNDFDVLSDAVDDQTVAVMLEPIQGEGGVIMPDDDYLKHVRNLCDEHDLLLILDEVWTGCGRTGQWFAHQHWDVEPDIMTLAKGVGGGLPVGVMCAARHVADLFDCRQHGVRHATTLGGNCLGMAVAAKVFEVIERDGLIMHAAAMGKHAADRLNAFAAKHPAVQQVRGYGLFLGVELDPTEAWFANAADVVAHCIDKGVLINGTQEKVLRLAPPLCISREELDEGLDVVEQVITG